MLALVLAGALIFHRFPNSVIESPPESVEEAVGQAESLIPENRVEVIEGIINTGDTITSILGQYFTPAQIHNLSKQSRPIFPLSRICAGQSYKLCLEEGDFYSFEYDIDRNAQLIIRKNEDGFQVDRVPIAYTVQQEIVRGTITSSLFDSVASIGENPELAIHLADIFAYDIDFIRDIRQGDSFQAVVERRFRDDVPAGYGQVLAAEFSNQGEIFRAFRFEDANRPAAYYDENGESRRGIFLRAPLSYTRISSGYTTRRFHPVNKVWRAHPAIDYAAPVGTPVMTVGDGVIERMGYTNANGNFLRVRHKNGYETIYLHMSRFAKGVKQGSRVSQGEIIGYVGSTGLATGPHLCFRMLKDGQPINPSSVPATNRVPVSRERMGDFKASIAPLVSLLEEQDHAPAGNEVASTPARRREVQ